MLPALLVAGSVDTAYALFSCVSMGQVGTKCCCPAARASEQASPCDELERASCCDDQRVEVQATPSQLSSPITPAVLSASFTRLSIRDLYAPVLVRESFAPRSAPRAAGPPLIILHRVLRL